MNPTNGNEPLVPAEVLKAFPGRPEQAIDPQIFNTMAFRHEIDHRLIDSMTSFLHAEFTGLQAVGMGNVVVGLSGGLDSVVVVRLCQLASGQRRRVQAVTVNLGRPGEAERVQAIRRTAELLAVEHCVIEGADLRSAALSAWPDQGPWSGINLDTRLIQTLLFQVADASEACVVATTDRSEHLLGRYTECFYGQVEPLAGLYKTEVVELGKRLGLLGLLVDARPGCEDYWYDDQVLGASYEVIDPLLQLLVVEGRSPGWIAGRYGIQEAAWLDGLANRIAVQPLRVQPRAYPVPPNTP